MWLKKKKETTRGSTFFPPCGHFLWDWLCWLRKYNTKCEHIFSIAFYSRQLYHIYILLYHSVDTHLGCRLTLSAIHCMNLYTCNTSHDPKQWLRHLDNWWCDTVHRQSHFKSNALCKAALKWKTQNRCFKSFMVRNFKHYVSKLVRNTRNEIKYSAKKLNPLTRLTCSLLLW